SHEVDVVSPVFTGSLAGPGGQLRSQPFLEVLSQPHRLSVVTNGIGIETALAFNDTQHRIGIDAMLGSDISDVGDNLFAGRGWRGHLLPQWTGAPNACHPNRSSRMNS